MTVVLHYLTVPIFNAVKYAFVTFIFQPAIEAQYRFATLETAQLRNGQQRVIRWRESNLGSLTLHGKWYNTKSRALLILAGVCLAVLSLVGEYGFDSIPQRLTETRPMWKLRPVDLLDAGSAVCLRDGDTGFYKTRCYYFWGKDLGCIGAQGKLTKAECDAQIVPINERRKVAPMLDGPTGQLIQLNAPRVVFHHLRMPDGTNSTTLPACKALATRETMPIGTATWVANVFYNADTMQFPKVDGNVTTTTTDHSVIKSIAWNLFLGCGSDGGQLWSIYPDDRIADGPHAGYTKAEEIAFSYSQGLIYSIPGNNRMCVFDNEKEDTGYVKKGWRGGCVTSSDTSLTITAAWLKDVPKTTDTFCTILTSTSNVAVSTTRKISVQSATAVLNMLETMPRFDFGGGSNILDARMHKISREMIAGLATRQVVVNGTVARRVVVGWETVPKVNMFGVVYALALVVLPVVILMWRFAHILCRWGQGLSCFDMVRSLVGDVPHRNGMYIGDSFEYVMDLWHRDKQGGSECSKPPKSKAGLGVSDKGGSYRIAVLEESATFRSDRGIGSYVPPPPDVYSKYEGYR